MLLAATLLLLLRGSLSAMEFSAQIDSFAVNGSVSIDTDSQILHANLTGACVNINISIHKFPVTYGFSRDPCHIQNIGPSLYHLRLNGSSSVHLEERLWPLGLSLVAETCGFQTCSNFHAANINSQAWHAIFHSFIVGKMYFLQVLGLNTITVLTELALLEGVPLSTASLYFSNSCQGHSRHSVGLAEIGHRIDPARNRKELIDTSMMPFILIEYQGQWACAEVRTLRSKNASALFSMHGVNGSFIFYQESPFHPTMIQIELWKLRGLAGNYSIHSLPVPARQEASQDLCGYIGTGGLWDPIRMHRNSYRDPSALGRNHNKWLMGEISARHGSLVGHQEFKAAVRDCNLSLYGTNSIIGRSVVISKTDGLQWVCSTILQDGKIVVAYAPFRKSIAGRIMFWQPEEDPDGELTILIELSNFIGITSMGHNWHVHEFPLQGEAEICSSAGAHFNPYKVPLGGNYSQDCKTSSPLLCEVGDYAGRHLPITLNGSSVTRYLFTDTSSSLTGPASIIGKSLVIHGPMGATFRVACANIMLQHTSKGRTGSWYGSGNALGELSASQVSDLDPTSVKITFQGLKGHAGGFHIHLLPVIRGSANPCANALIQGHFNPFAVNTDESPASGDGTDDEYEVGDISGRRGSLVNKDQMTTQYRDLNFPLSGKHNILGRSLVIHYINGSRMQCATFLPELTSDGDWVQATAVFTGNISGSISLTQLVYSDGGYGDTSIVVDLQTLPGTQYKNISLQWFISMPEKGAESYNPYEIPNQAQSFSLGSPVNPLHCRVGDLSTKHGNLTSGVKQLFTDPNLLLIKDITVLGLNLTIKWDNQQHSAQILPAMPVTSLTLPGEALLNRSAFLEAVSLALRVPSWKVTLLPEKPEKQESCRNVTFFVIGFNDTAALASLQDHRILGFNISSCRSLPVPSGGCKIWLLHYVMYCFTIFHILLI